MDKELAFVIPSSSAAMESALNAQGLGSSFALIFEQFPVLRQICLALSGHFLRLVPDAKRSSPLLDVCFQNAYSSFRRAEYSDLRLCFIRGLMSATPDVLYWSLYINRRFDGPVCWDCVECGLCDWMLQNLRRPEIVFRHELQHSIIAPNSYRQLLCYKLIPAELILSLAHQFHLAYSEY
ncbi:hypothetical protein [Duganella vulcania]|uniref:Uncharacterized protein n=1 Tax=Duganella vulcania TaxID=2692166 RepID=A0A845GJ89_9BURK|nr:hypothetical protein [Duganella vulcania]MYM92719.1 hypothetical protein [Duganella vulcania]